MILVTGGTGLVGLHLLIELLSQQKKPIRALYRSKAKKDFSESVFKRQYPDVASAEAQWNSIDWVKADITDVPSLETVFDGITEVYHCAGMVSFHAQDFLKLKKVNIEGTANMVNLSLYHKVEKFCHVSSVAVLNLNPGETELHEGSQWNNELDNSGYAISKHGAEMEVWRGVQEGLQAVIVNPTVVLGEGFYETGSGEIFKKVKKGVPFYTAGSSGYVYVKDVCKIMHQLMQKELFNQSFVLVSENKTYKEMITEVALKLGVHPPKMAISKIIVKSIARLETMLSSVSGYTPKIPIDVVESLYTPSVYNGTKILNTLNFSYTSFDQMLAHCVQDIKHKKSH